MKIRSPKTKRLITINGVAYKNLIKNDKYTESDLLLLIEPKFEKIKVLPENVGVGNLELSVESSSAPVGDGRTTPVKNELILPEDVMKEILLLSNFETIKNYCSTKKYQNICNQVAFWTFIFKRDNIEIIGNPSNTSEWIKEYETIQNAKKESKLIMQYHKNSKDDILYIQIDQNDSFNSYIIKKYGSVYRGKHQIYSKKYLNFYQIFIGPYSKNMYLEEYINYISDLLYFYPNLYIFTRNKIPLRKKDIIKVANFTGYKSHAKKLLAFYKKYE
jgi:hypothetical protein